MRDSKTISMEGSEQLSWDDIDEHASKHGFNTTASFIQYLAEKEILGIHKKIQDVITYVMLMLLFVIILLLLIIQ